MKPKTLREYKENQGLTIKELAIEFGISPVYVAFLLSRKRKPSSQLAKTISEKTGIPVLSLLYPQGESHGRQEARG